MKISFNNLDPDIRRAVLKREMKFSDIAVLAELGVDLVHQYVDQFWRTLLFLRTYKERFDMRYEAYPAHPELNLHVPFLLFQIYI